VYHRYLIIALSSALCLSCITAHKLGHNRLAEIFDVAAVNTLKMWHAMDLLHFLQSIYLCSCWH